MKPILEKLCQMAPSDVFETYMVPALFAPWTEGLLDSARIQPGDRILDVACGTGIVARTAYRKIGSQGRIVGLDLSADQLVVARRLEEAVEWRKGNATDLPFADGEFNVVTCQQGLQFFPDRQKALDEMCRVLAPKGRLATSVWCSVDTCPGYAALHESLARHVGEPALTPFKSIFSFHNGQAIQQLLLKAGLASANIHTEVKLASFGSAREFVAIVLRGSNLARSGIVLDDHVVEVIQSEVSDKLERYAGPDGIALPMKANIAGAVK